MIRWLGWNLQRLAGRLPAPIRREWAWWVRGEPSLIGDLGTLLVWAALLFTMMALLAR